MTGVGGEGSPREAAAAAVAGAVLGAWASGRAGLRGVPRAVVAAIAAANGAVSGRRGIYDWSEPGGTAAFVLDSTWSVTNTFAGLAVHGAQLLHRDSDFRPELSRRRNRHVYAGGFAVRRGFVFTQGNVVSAAGGTGDRDLTSDQPEALRRRLLLERHEDLHVWQARWFGPLYVPFYVGWMAFGALRGTIRWARRRDHSLWDHVDVAAYYENPFERWAYATDHRWPHPRVKSVLGSSS